MERPIRRKDREISEQEARALLQSAEYGVLSTVGEDGVPYGVPVSFVLVQDKLYFHCAKTGHKIDNLSHQPRVSFCVVGGTEPVMVHADFSTYYESAVVAGTARLVEDQKEHQDALYALCEKYFQDEPDFAGTFERSMAGSGPRTAVYCIQVERITGKAKRMKPGE